MYYYPAQQQQPPPSGNIGFGGTAMQQQPGPGYPAYPVPGAGPTSGYPPQQQPAAFPPGPGYPAAGGAPQPNIYPPQQAAGYPPQQIPSYPPQMGAPQQQQPTYLGLGQQQHQPYPPPQSQQMGGQPSAPYPQMGGPQQPTYPLAQHQQPQMGQEGLYGGSMAAYPPQPQSGGASAPMPLQQSYGGAPGGGYPSAGAMGQVYGGASGAGYPSTTGQPYGGAPGAGYHAAAPSVQTYGQPAQQYGGGGGGVLQTQQGTVRDWPQFSASQDAQDLKKAMRGIGCNDSAVINIICRRSNSQRQQIGTSYKQMYGKDLTKELISELRGNFETLIVALMYSPAAFDAMQLRQAMEGAGTTESTLIEILATRPNNEIKEIRNAYRYMYNRDLERDLSSETSGYFRRLLVGLSTGGRDESNRVDMARAQQDAQALIKAGVKRLGTDESTFNAILAGNNWSQLQAVFQEYQKMAGHDLEQAIRREFSGDIEDGLTSLVKIVRNRTAYFAEQLYKSMQGMGTKDTALIRLVVTRCEVDMVQIKQEFQRMHNRALEQMISSDTSGNYKNGLVALVQGF